MAFIPTIKNLHSNKMLEGGVVLLTAKIQSQKPFLLHHFEILEEQGGWVAWYQSININP